MFRTVSYLRNKGPDDKDYMGQCVKQTKLKIFTILSFPVSSKMRKLCYFGCGQNMAHGDANVLRRFSMSGPTENLFWPFSRDWVSRKSTSVRFGKTGRRPVLALIITETVLFVGRM